MRRVHGTEGKCDGNEVEEFHHDPSRHLLHESARRIRIAPPRELDARFMQGLIDAGLVSTERPASLQHKRDAVATLRPPARNSG